jgi:hypothetical protein
MLLWSQAKDLEMELSATKAQASKVLEDLGAAGEELRDRARLASCLMGNKQDGE